MSSAPLQRLLVIVFLLYSGSAFGQAEFLVLFSDGHYPVDSLYRKLRVRKVIDALIDDPQPVHVSEYDRHGRLIREGVSKDGISMLDEYHQHGDTLIRLGKFNGEEIPAGYFKEERFVYNARGKILFYLAAGKRIFRPGDECAIENFFYDADGRIIRSERFIGRYPAGFKPGTLPPQDSFSAHAITKYITDEESRIIFKERRSGQEQFNRRDSFLYDGKGRLIREVIIRKGNTYQPPPWPDEMYVTSYMYSPGRRTQKDQRFIDTGGGWILEDESLEEDLLNEKGLPVKRNSIGNGSQALIKTTRYEYFK